MAELSIWWWRAFCREPLASFLLFNSTELTERAGLTWSVPRELVAKNRLSRTMISFDSWFPWNRPPNRSRQMEAHPKLKENRQPNRQRNKEINKQTNRQAVSVVAGRRSASQWRHWLDVEFITVFFLLFLIYFFYSEAMASRPVKQKIQLDLVSLNTLPVRWLG